MEEFSKIFQHSLFITDIVEMSHRLNKTLDQIKVNIGKIIQIKFFTMETVEKLFLKLELCILELKTTEMQVNANTEIQSVGDWRQ